MGDIRVGEGERGEGPKKRIAGDHERRNLFTIARDLGRFPSELFEVGKREVFFEFVAGGWLGKILRFRGIVRDGRRPIGSQEFDDMMGLYLIEAEEREEARRNGGQDG